MPNFYSHSYRWASRLRVKLKSHSWALVALLALMSASCRGFLTWATVYRSVSPDKESELLVQETNCLSDCALRVVLSTGWRVKEIASKADCSVNFAHAEWSGTTVAAFVDGFWCGDIRVAYDVKARRAVDFQSAEPWLRSSIIKSYDVTDSELKSNQGDVFAWATYPGDGNARRSSDEFRKRFAGP
jgi:hypothetical protein